MISLTASTNFHACGGGLSVTADAQVSDNGKTKNGRHPIPDAGRCESRTNFRYGVISQTTPDAHTLRPGMSVP